MRRRILNLSKGITFILLLIISTAINPLSDWDHKDVTLQSICNSAQAGCEMEVRVFGIWKLLFSCDKTPNETCSVEGTADDGEHYSFSCDGKETYNYWDE